MDLASAFSLFGSLVAARRSTVTQDGDVAIVQADGASLRLRHDRENAALLLEITRGIDDHVWWLDLFSGQCDGLLCQPNANEPTLAESIEYGLDLMQLKPLAD